MGDLVNAVLHLLIVLFTPPYLAYTITFLAGGVVGWALAAWVYGRETR